MNLEAWFKEFEKEKEEVGSFPVSGKFAVHSVRRFLDKKGQLPLGCWFHLYKPLGCSKGQDRE